MIFTFLLIISNGVLISSIQSNEEHPNETNSYIQDRDTPKFGEPIQNQTIAVGREAVFSCVVDNLQTYKIAWLKVDTQTILSIQTHIITKNHRMTVSHVENRAWVLRIKEVKESDKGWYMCQINTDPMKNQVGFLNVVVPPDILDYPTSTDMVVREGSNVTLKCAARGSPTPNITWRREGSEPIALAGNKEVTSHNGSILSISRVNRLHMGAYLCIAQNGIPPSVSKRVMLIVHFPPMVWIQNQLVGSAIGQKITLECQSEAHPKSINYWMKNDTIITNASLKEFIDLEAQQVQKLMFRRAIDKTLRNLLNKSRMFYHRSSAICLKKLLEYPDEGKRYEPVNIDNTYKVVMKLTINSVSQGDFGSYRCVSKNSLGDTDGSIKLYHIPQATMQTTLPPTTTTTTKMITTTSVHRNENMIDKMSNYKSIDDYLILKNVGGTSGQNWNADSRDRDHRLQSESIASTEVQKMNEHEISSSTSLLSSKTLALIYSLYCYLYI
ncbi:CLUMA_CG007736, isoform A [Clunio marinus]|uniref:CLUMA_CG007736, isoform A n=1 Tax=Clunio marinus TaxID=568069 RepID=A0A1J1I1Q7_9DIPT|nr:CLUMA_CG007736, isoform A [Clunio marinus]